jgi:anti-sigma B factor antagonist
MQPAGQVLKHEMETRGAERTCRHTRRGPDTWGDVRASSGLDAFLGSVAERASAVCHRGDIRVAFPVGAHQPGGMGETERDSGLLMVGSLQSGRLRMDETPFDFRIEVEKSGDQVALTIAGDVDLATAPMLINRVQSLFNEPVAELALDLTKVTFLDSSGIAALIKANTTADEHDARFTLASASPEVRRILRSTGLAERFGLT